jgi:hypothetical protein
MLKSSNIGQSRSTLSQNQSTVGHNWNGLSDASRIARAAYDYDWSSNVDSLEKLGRKIFRHSHQPWDAGYPGRVPAVHANRRPQSRVVRHRRGSQMPGPGELGLPGVAFELMTLPKVSTTDPKLRER